MKKQFFVILAAALLSACSAADLQQIIKEEIARGVKDIGNNGSSRAGVSAANKNRNTAGIEVVNSQIEECQGITLHNAYLDESPFYYQGQKVATIPVYKATITNEGKRRKVTFDIYYKQDFGNEKYGTKQPTQHYLKEYGPVTLRAGTIEKDVNFGKPEGREVYEKIELVSCE